MDINDTACKLFEKAVSSIQRKNDKEKVKDMLLVKQAKVVGCDSAEHKAVVYFLDDTKQTNYMIYNKTAEELAEGDNVKVFYTTNPAKGWIGMRLGSPNYPDTAVVPYVSKNVRNVEDVELGVVPAVLLDVDFKVDGNDSDTVFTANQIINVSSDGVAEYSYEVDSVPLDFKLRRTITSGWQTITHIIPMPLLIGEHNLKIRQTSQGANGITALGNLSGVLSGQISGLDVHVPPNYNCILKIKATAGEAVTIPQVTNENCTGIIAWGDGNSEVYSNTEISHIYEKDGEYKVTFVMNMTTFGTGVYSKLTGRSDILGVVISENIKEILDRTFMNCSSLSSVSFGSNLISIGADCFNSTSISGNIVLPASLQTLGSSAFIRCPNITRVTIDCPVLTSMGGSVFSNCGSLVSVEYNAPAAIGRSAFSLCANLKKVKIGALTSELGFNCFSTTGVEEVSLTRITKSNGYAFSHCYSLKSIDFGESTVIGQGEFDNCTALEQVDLPSTITQIGMDAFHCATALKYITIPNSVKFIGARAFEGTMLTSVTTADDCDYNQSGQWNVFPTGCLVNGVPYGV